jgi:hypothetical protein
MKSHWVEHQGKRIFIADFSGFGMNSEALQEEANEIITMLKQEPPNSVCSISNVKGTTATVENVKILQSILPHTNEQVWKRCVVGVTGLRWYFVEVINDFTGDAKMITFGSLEEALDWIVEE